LYGTVDGVWLFSRVSSGQSEVKSAAAFYYLCFFVSRRNMPRIIAKPIE
jgi:hypothetical protein